MTNIQLILVVETNDNVKSDDAYFAYLFKYMYGEYLKVNGKNNIHLDYKFVYMDGKGNYKSSRVSKDILDYKNEYQIGKSEVLYCFDIDSVSKDNMVFYAKVKDYCISKNYKLVISNKEIEDVLNVPAGSSKKERVKNFAKHYPSPNTFDFSHFKVPTEKVFDKVGQINLGYVVDLIIENSIDNKKK